MLLFLLKTKGVSLDGIIDDRNMELIGNIIDHLDSEQKYNLLLRVAERGVENLFRYVTFLIYRDIDVHRCYDKLFRTLCERGYTDMARFFYFFNDGIDIHACDDYAFKTSINNSHLETARWLYHLTNGNLDVHMFDDFAIKTCCSNGQFEAVQWLYNRFKDGIIDEKVLYDCFKNTCINGNIEIAKLLLRISTKPGNKLNIHAHNEAPFNHACANGHLDMCKFLLTIDGKINIHCVDNWAFAICCMDEHMDMAKWLLSHDDTLNVNDAFVYACIGGSLKMAQYLYNTGKVTDIQYKDEAEQKDPFVHACKSGNLELVKWLYGLENTFYNWCKSFIVTNDQKERYQEAFISACKSGNVAIVDWIHKRIGIELNFALFATACKEGHYNIVKYLLDHDSNIDIFANNNEAFKICCIYGQFEMFKWLIEFVSVDSKYKKKLDFQELFILSCSNYNYKLSHYIYDLDPYNIDIRAQNDKAFRNYCSIGEIDGAQWLYNLSIALNDPIDIRMKDPAIYCGFHRSCDFIFLEACETNRIELASWLASLCSDYCFETKNSEIVNYHVL